MKLLFILSMIVCSACYGQVSVLSTPTFSMPTDTGLQQYKSYIELLRQRNNSIMAARGYTKAVDSIRIPYGNWRLQRTKSQEVHYNLSDSVWINHDTTYVVFRYFTKRKKTAQDIKFERHFSNY